MSKLLLLFISYLLVDVTRMESDDTADIWKATNETFALQFDLNLYAQQYIYVKIGNDDPSFGFACIALEQEEYGSKFEVCAYKDNTLNITYGHGKLTFYNLFYGLDGQTIPLTINANNTTEVSTGFQLMFCFHPLFFGFRINGGSTLSNAMLRRLFAFHQSKNRFSIGITMTVEGESMVWGYHKVS